MKSTLCAAIIILSCSMAVAQTMQSIELEDCVLSIEIPLRLVEISSNEKEIIYRDRKTNSILTFNKAVLTDYEFDLDFNAERIHSDLSEDRTYKEVSLTKMKMDYANVYLIEWTIDEQKLPRRNNCHTMAMMKVCKQYYNFTFNLPESHREDVSNLLNDILTSIQKEENPTLAEPKTLQ